MWTKLNTQADFQSQSGAKSKLKCQSRKVGEVRMNDAVLNVLSILDFFRKNNEMTYSAYSTLHDEVSLLDDLMKEQEPKTIKDHYIPSDDMGIENGECPSCGKRLPRAVYPVACGYCGQLLKWFET